MTMRRMLAAVSVAWGLVLLGGCSRPGPPPEGGPPPRAQDAAGGAPAAPSTADAVLPVLRYLPLDTIAAPDTPRRPRHAVIVGGHALVFTRQLLSADGQDNPTGTDAALAQCQKVLGELDVLLKSAGSSLEKLVRLHVCGDSTETLQQFDQALAQHLPGEVHPAITRVVSPLPDGQAMLGVDAVAIAAAASAGPSVRLVHCPGLAVSPGAAGPPPVADPLGSAGSLQMADPLNSAGPSQVPDPVASAGPPQVADAAVVPWGGFVWFSGQAEKGTATEAAAKALEALWKTMAELKLEPAQIVQLKIFVDSMSAADDVSAEIARRFPAQSVPPLVFVQWIASAPVEIEMVAWLPGGSAPAVPQARSAPSSSAFSSPGAAPHARPSPSDTVLRYYNPPDVKPSPNFSRVVLSRADRLVFIPGLVSRTPGDGTAQVRDIFAQLEEILRATGSDRQHLAKATYYVSDAEASAALDKLRSEYYDPQRPPAASKAMVRGVGQAERSLAIEMIAVPLALPP